MCQFKSFIALKDRVYFDLKEESHSQLLEKLGIKDDYLNATKSFVRCEIIPKDGDLFNHSMDNWKLNVDQDIVPDWFDKDEVEGNFKDRYLPEVFEKCFAIDEQSCKEYRDTKVYVKNSKIRVFNSSVVACENSSVVARGNSSVEACGNSSVVARDNSSVVARENSSVEAYGNSSVEAYGNSSVVACENSSVVARGNSSVVARGNSSVVARENSSVEAFGNSSVEAFGNSSVVARDNSSVLIPYSTGINIKGVHDFATIKDLSGKPKIIIASDFDMEKFTKKLWKNLKTGLMK
ncbi:MAG: hypothetical protein N3I35_12550 [Clostridia bacterium]|nr:hypothetical protein [Clostridia bacterium]